MELPGSLYLECEECGEETLHEVLKGRATEKGGGVRLAATVKCGECGTVRRINVREGGEQKVNAILSDSSLSQRMQVALEPDSTVEVGDTLVANGLPCLVTSIEVGGRRPSKAGAGEITTLWLKRYDKVRVKVSINWGKRTVARELWAAPEEEFEIGDVVTVGDIKVLVHSIKTPAGKVHRGSVKARLVRRLYGREVQ